MIEANLCDELSQATVLDASTSKFPTFPPSLFTSFDFMSRSPALSDLPVEDDRDPRVDQATGHSELGITVRSGALSTRVASDASFASDPENPSTDSISNPHSPVQPTLSSNAVLPKGTPSAIGALRLHKSAVFQSYSTPFRNRNLNLISPQINITPTKAVNEEANFILEAARAQHNMCILEQQLAAVKVDETIALGNLYRFRAQTAECKLEDANIDVGRIRHDICKSGIILHNPRKRRRASFTESTVACISSVNTEDINVPRQRGSSHHKFITSNTPNDKLLHELDNNR
ncbi:hypothetical protein BKA83DRAFT_4129604 [Pisolithus microcarpus]|nr:hypothetical protein BKA83DRAFT_4129604 [Pisolithus microcarpus]